MLLPVEAEEVFYPDRIQNLLHEYHNEGSLFLVELIFVLSVHSSFFLLIHFLQKNLYINDNTSPFDLKGLRDFLFQLYDHFQEP